MSISTNWKDDGALVIRCGSEQLEIPADQLPPRGGGGSGGAASSGPRALYFFPDITTGEPNAICGVVTKTNMAVECASVDTMDGFAAVVTKAMAGTNPPNELVIGWNSKRQISITDVKEIVRAHRSKHLAVQLRPIFLEP
jgi:hypothetical protein